MAFLLKLMAEPIHSSLSVSAQVVITVSLFRTPALVGRCRFFPDWVVLMVTLSSSSPFRSRVSSHASWLAVPRASNGKIKIAMPPSVLTEVESCYLEDEQLSFKASSAILMSTPWEEMEEVTSRLTCCCADGCLVMLAHPVHPAARRHRSPTSPAALVLERLLYRLRIQIVPQIDQQSFSVCCRGSRWLRMCPFCSQQLRVVPHQSMRPSDHVHAITRQQRTFPLLSRP